MRTGLADLLFMVCGNDVMFERELPYWVVNEKPNTADCRLLLLMTAYIWERTWRFFTAYDLVHKGSNKRAISAYD